MSETLTLPPPSLEAPKLRPNETNEVYLSPFWQGKGSPFPDSTIPYLFARTKEDRLLRRIFPGEEEVSLPWFIEKLSRWPLVVGIDKASQDVMAYSFLSEYDGRAPYRKANIGYCYFRKFWGSPKTRDLARLALDWWFCKEGIGVLYGTLLVRNRLAARFFKEMHFRELCRLPMFFHTEHGPEDSLLVCLQRDEFLRIFGSKFGDHDARNH